MAPSPPLACRRSLTACTTTARWGPRARSSTSARASAGAGPAGARARAGRREAGRARPQSARPGPARRERAGRSACHGRRGTPKRAANQGRRSAAAGSRQLPPRPSRPLTHAPLRAHTPPPPPPPPPRLAARPQAPAPRRAVPQAGGRLWRRAGPGKVLQGGRLHRARAARAARPRPVARRHRHAPHHPRGRRAGARRAAAAAAASGRAPVAGGCRRVQACTLCARGAACVLGLASAATGSSSWPSACGRDARRRDRPPTQLICDADTCPRIPRQVASLDPGTHAYSFWEGVPREGKAAFGRLFRTSRTLKVRPRPLRAAPAAFCRPPRAPARLSPVCWLLTNAPAPRCAGGGGGAARHARRRPLPGDAAAGLWPAAADQDLLSQHVGCGRPRACMRARTR